MCTAVNFSNRILYSTFLRLIVSFRIRQSETDPPCLDYIDYNRDHTVTAACPKDFKTTFEVRDQQMFDVCMQKSAESCKDVTNGIVK